MNPNFKLIVGDIRHIEDITKAIQGVDAVVHLAGIVGDPACALYPLSTIEQNYLSTVLLAKICKYNQINRFVFASSCSVYGQGKEILDEDSSLSPVSLYARDKINSEKALLELEDENFSPTILRMGTIYGMSYRPRFDLVLNIITALAATKGEFTINGGDQWRPMVHVADAASAYVLALESSLDDVKGQVFNVGSEEQNYRIIELGETVRRMIPSKMIISEDNVDKRDYRVDFGKIRKLGFIAKHTIEEGVGEIGDAVRKGLQFQDKKNSNYRFLSS